MNTPVTFHQSVKFQGYTGFVVAQAESTEPSVLVAFPKPDKDRGESNDNYNNRLSNWAATFQCDPEHLGPCVNRIVALSETET